MKEVRPTSGRVLSAMFSILGGRVEGAKFLDLFAGTGRVGLEALRRGAESCIFVESVKARAEEIRRQVPLRKCDTPPNLPLSGAEQRQVPLRKGDLGGRTQMITFKEDEIS